jgi:hypothetical protein
LKVTLIKFSIMAGLLTKNIVLYTREKEQFCLTIISTRMIMTLAFGLGQNFTLVRFIAWPNRIFSSLWHIIYILFRTSFFVRSWSRRH